MSANHLLRINGVHRAARAKARRAARYPFRRGRRGAKTPDHKDVRTLDRECDRLALNLLVREKARSLLKAYRDEGRQGFRERIFNALWHARDWWQSCIARQEAQREKAPRAAS